MTGKFIVLALFGRQEVVVMHQEEEFKSAGELIVSKLPTEEIDVDEQATSGSKSIDAQQSED